MATSLIVTSDDSVMKLPSAALTNRLLQVGRIVDRPPAGLDLDLDDLVPMNRSAAF